MPELFEPHENPTPDENPASLPDPREGMRPEAAEPQREGVSVLREQLRERHNRDVNGVPVERRPVTKSQRYVLGFTWLALFFMLIYPIFILMSSFTPGYAFLDRIANILLLLGTGFIFIHGLGYANSMIKAASLYDEVKKRVFSPQREPKVVCVIACFNEPLDILEETVAAMANLDYANKEVVVLDDSTNEEIRQGVREIGARYGATVRQRTNRRGYKAGAINDFLRTTDAPYVAIFDADGLPAHNLLRDLMPIIEENPRLAFVQTPQYYANTDVSNVALAASRQQAVFYEYICEGKSYSRAAFCCGTNVVFRRDALLAIGGFDENSVTEDFITSLGLHLKGYDSTYYNQVYAYSMAPETLGAYFTQQSRWAVGSVGGMWKVLKGLVTKPGAMSFGQWWEYFLSSTYYWIGWVNFIFMVLPLLYIFFSIKPLRADVFSYAMIFVPYLVFSMNMFYSGMEQRGYKVGDMLAGQQIGFLSFPVHMTSAIAGLFGRKRAFAVTPKGDSDRLSWLSLWPQLLMLVLSGAGFAWGMWQYFGSGLRRQDGAIVVNALWALYSFVLLAGIFRLNKSVRDRTPQRYFADDQGRLYHENDERVRPADGSIPVGAVATTTPTGRIARPALATPVREPRTSSTGRVALVLAVLSVIGLGAVAFTMISWALKPSTPVNVYVLDRTTGRDYQEHRGLSWTLNFSKIAKQKDFDAGSGGDGHSYDWAKDFYGFVPGVAADARQEPNRDPADIIGGGVNRPLPDSLKTPGVLYIADTYGEFVEWDPTRSAYVYYRSQPRGVTPPDVDKAQDFYNRGGLVMAEWNTIGYPTLPGKLNDYAAGDASVKAQIAEIQKGITYLQTRELPDRQAQLKKARAVKNDTWAATMEDQIRDTQRRIDTQTRKLAQARAELDKRATYGEQLAAQQQLENILHVDYQGWYGRYVDNFETEHEYDWRLYKNVNAFDKQRFPNGPKGPGFVFYQDGPSQVTNDQTGKPEENPFSKPVVILQDELRSGNIEYVSGIYKAGKTATGVDTGADPLLKDVAASVPAHYWFELVQPKAGSTVLSYYKLMVTDKAIARLKSAGFPAAYLKENTPGGPQVIFPAAIAYRENGKLRSFYMAGDASDYTLVPRVAEAFPSSGGVFSFFASHAGSYSQQYYWNYYYPMLRNVMTQTKQVQYSAGKS